MPLLVPNVGEVIVLNNFLNKVAPENQTLKLYVNNITPAESDTAATYTEATGGGYASKSLTGASWTVTGGAPTNAVTAQQTYTFTGALTTNPIIYGYFVIQTTSGILMWAERAAATFTPASNGDEYRVTPRIEAD